MHQRPEAGPEAVIFDLDGVLIDSEPSWNAAKEALVEEAGGRWRDEAPTAMMGMSSPEWATYLRDELGVPMDIEAISAEVVRRMMDGYAGSFHSSRAPFRPCARWRPAGRSGSPPRRTGRSSTWC